MNKSQGAARKRPATPSKVRAGSFGEWLQYLGVKTTDEYWRLPYWPPDVYAVTAAYLKRTGAYVKFVDERRISKGKVKARSEEQVGREWREMLSEDLRKVFKGKAVTFRFPREFNGWWNAFTSDTTKSFAEAGSTEAIQRAAWSLCIVSDVASRGIGLRTEFREDEKQAGKDPFLAAAQALLVNNEGRSFCLEIPVDKLAVLGKQHTPQRGCTIRSLTHHLSLYIPSEIQAYWAGPWPRAKGLDVLNLLLLPWPTKVETEDFRMGEATAASTRHGYFHYQPRRDEAPANLIKRVKRALEMAERHADKIHGIVFPELALTLKQFSKIEELAVKKGAVLIAGVRDRVGKADANTCVIQPYALTSDSSFGRPTKTLLKEMRHTQLKHHRWRLDRNQILQYDLGSRIPAERDCWEGIHLGERKITFITLTAWLTICVLICEDLARQDPVSEVVRSVGPNLVFSLLMDGPQLANRWPARYASVLAEDPGCSVLTMTSLGMCTRSTPPNSDGRSTPRSRAIGLWRDKWYNERVIELPEKDDACVLSLVCRSDHEFTLDGRHDEGQAHFPVFAGIHSFEVGP